MADLLIDEGIGQHLVQQLRAQGYRIFHTLEFLPKGASDSLVFLEAQRRQLTVFTWNRDDFILLAVAWQNWGHGSHYGVISRPEHAQQRSVPDIYRALEHYCRDPSSFVDRIELFGAGLASSPLCGVPSEAGAYQVRPARSRRYTLCGEPITPRNAPSSPSKHTAAGGRGRGKMPCLTNR